MTRSKTPFAAALWLLAAAACKHPTPSATDDAPVCRYRAALPAAEALASEPWRPAVHDQSLLPAGQLASVGSARCWWSDDGIALVVRFVDSDLQAHVSEDDGRTWDDDVAEWFLAPATNGDYAELHVTPRGTTLALTLDEARQRKRTPQRIALTTAVQLDGTLNDSSPDRAWQAAMVVPWAALPGEAPQRGDQWWSHVARYDHAPDRPPQLSSTTRFDELDFHRRGDWKPLVFR